MMAKERALGKHIRYIWCYGAYLLCELVPFRDVAIGIAQISNMKNHLIVCNIFDKLISCIKNSMLVLVVLIRAISFILHEQSIKYTDYSFVNWVRHLVFWNLVIFYIFYLAGALKLMDK